MEKLVTLKVLSGTIGRQTGARFVDNGRPGLRHLAIPTGGAVDGYAHAIANQLVGNPAGSPTLEIPLKGGSYQFSAACRIVLTGANFAWSLDGQPVPQYQIIEVKAKQILQGSFSKNGAYCYLTVAGKWDIPCSLGSHEPAPWAESTMDRDSRNANIHNLENRNEASETTSSPKIDDTIVFIISDEPTPPKKSTELETPIAPVAFPTPPSSVEPLKLGKPGESLAPGGSEQPEESVHPEEKNALFDFTEPNDVTEPNGVTEPDRGTEPDGMREPQKTGGTSLINQPTSSIEFPAQARDDKSWKFWMSKINNRITVTPSRVSCPLYTGRNETLELVVFPGPEFSLLSPSAQEEFFASSWQLTSVRSRQGIRLVGNSIALKDGFAASSMISSPVLPGTVQLTPSGPIILGPDAQTVGGYPRIAVLSPRDIRKCFQASTGGYLKFRLV